MGAHLRVSIELPTLRIPIVREGILPFRSRRGLSAQGQCDLWLVSSAKSCSIPCYQPARRDECRRWGDAEFATICRRLRAAADQRLQLVGLIPLDQCPIRRLAGGASTRPALPF